MSIPKIITDQKIPSSTRLRALELRRDPTPAESILWQRLCANRLAGWHFRRQQIILGYIVDFYCHQAGLVIEVDGEIHQQSEQHHYDIERTQAFTTLGLRVLRFPNERIFTDLENVLAEITAACNLSQNLSPNPLP